MPYHVAKTTKCPSSKPWGCIKTSTGKVMGCHPTKAKAEKQMAALYANEPKGQSNGMNREEIRAARAERAKEVPGGQARMHRFPAQLRAKLVQKDGKDYYEVTGFATIYDKPYEMYDMFGTYKETMDGHALTKSLMAEPDVAFLTNHRGITMARTTNGTLELKNARRQEDSAMGLSINAFLNAQRTDVRDIASAIGDELVDEMSFAFMLNDGEWNDDYSEFRITEADINRGDVSAVNYGANPYTSISARAAEFMDVIADMPVSMARATFMKLTNRSDLDFSDWITVDETGEDDASQESAPEGAERDAKPAEASSAGQHTAEPTGRSLDMVDKRYRAWHMTNTLETD